MAGSVTYGNPLYKALHAKLDPFIIVPEARLPAIAQLCLDTLRRLPEGIFDPKTHHINYEFPVAQHLGRFNLIDKISLLFAVLGPWKACDRLREMGCEQVLRCSLPPSSEIARFSEQLSLLTDGVFTTYQMAALPVLRMQLFANLEALHATEELHNQLMTAFCHIFNLLAKNIQEDCFSSESEAKHLVTACRGHIDKILANSDGAAHLAPRREACQLILAGLDLVSAAMDNPLPLLPLLHRRLSSMRSQPGGHENLLKFHPTKVLVWLENSQTAFRVQSAHFFSLVEKTLKENKKWKAFQVQLLTVKRIGTNGADEMGRVIQKVKKVCREGSWDQNRLMSLERLSQEILRDAFQIRDSFYFPLGNEVGNFLTEISRQLPKSQGLEGVQYELMQPFSNFMNSVLPICTALNLYCNLYRDIKKFVYPPYLEVHSAHVALVDLLEGTARSMFNMIRDEPSVDLQVEKANLDMLLLLFAEIRAASGNDSSQIPSLEKALSYVAQNREKSKFAVHEMLEAATRLLCSEWGISFLQQNPYAAPEENPQANALFFSHNFKMLLQSVQELDIALFYRSFEIALRLPVQENEKIWAERITSKVEFVINFFALWKNDVHRAYTDEEYDAYKMGIFLDNLSQFGIVLDTCESLVETIEQECQNPSVGFTGLLNHFRKVRSFFYSKFLSFSKPLVGRRLELELLSEETAEVPQVVPIAPPKPPKKEKNLLEEKRKELALLCQATSLQNEHAAVMRHLMEDFRELIPALPEHGHQPFFIAQLTLRVATAIEQCAKYAADLRGITLPEGHSLSPMLREIRKTVPGILGDLNLPDLDRVIAVSSRYPAMGVDELSDRLETAFKGRESDELQNVSEELLLIGLDHCIALLQQEEKGKPSTIKIMEEQIRGWLIPLPPVEAQDSTAICDALSKWLHRIQLLHISDRRVPLLHAWEESGPRRQRTFASALANLSMSLQMCRNLLSFPEEPALCITLGSALLLQQAVLQEQFQLAALAFLPVKSLRHDDQHYLFDIYEERLPRHAHSLVRNSKTLKEWQFELEGHSEENENMLELFLKNHFRYPGPEIAILDKLYGLSILHDLLIRDELTPLQELALEQALGDSSLQKLQACMAQTLREIKKDLVKKLQQVASGLQKLERRIKENC